MLFSTISTLFSGGQIRILDVMMQILAVLFIIFCILPIHELAHAWMAYKLGDDTAKWHGRLTFNPLASIDPMGALCILLFGFGWAKPVPVNPRNFKHPKRGMAITALAGPVSNIIVSVIGALLLNALYAIFGVIPSFLLVFFNYYILINISLAVFNLLPIPPLDGSKILGAFLPDRIMFAYYKYQNVIIMVLFALLFLGVLDVPLGFLRSGLWNAVMWLGSLPFRLFS